MGVKCEVWSMTVKIEQKLSRFENKVLRTICRPLFDTAIHSVKGETRK